MARLLIIFDPTSRLEPCPQDMSNDLILKQAIMDVADDLDSSDIYAISEKLCSMLLEQIRS